MNLHAALILLSGAALTLTGKAERALFAMDTGTRDGQTKTYAQQAALVKELKFSGPIGLQHYGIKGSARENLGASMQGWKGLSRKTANK